MAGTAIIELLLKIGSIFGITPPNQKSKWNLKTHYYYSSILLFILLVLSVLSVYCSAKFGNIREMRKTEVFVDISTSLSLIAQGTSIATSYLIRPKLWLLFINELQDNNWISAKHTHDFFELGMAHLIFFSKHSLQTITWIAIIGFKKHIFYSFRVFHEYFAMFTTCFVVAANKLMKRKFFALNNSLKRTKCDSEQIKHLQKVYRKLLGIVDDFNCIFGYQILFIVGNTIAVILEGSQNALIFKGEQNETIVLVWSTLSTSIAMVKFCFFFTNFIMCLIDFGFLVATHCNCGVVR